MLALINNPTDDSVDGETMSIGSADNINSTTLAEVVRDDIDLSLDIEDTEPAMATLNTPTPISRKLRS